MAKRLYRPKENRVIAGVCAGFAEYFDIDISLIRVIAIVATILGGSGVLAYLVAWIVVPEKPES